MKRFIKIALVLFLIMVIPMVTIFSLILYYAVQSKPQKADVMIVLGCQVMGKTPSLSLQYRLEKAKELYGDYAPYIIVSGGQGANEEIPEAEAMKLWLVNQGIPADRIYEEDRSTSTYENIRFSKDIMDKEGFETALIVSNDFHIFRAVKLAERLGIEAAGAPAPTVDYLKAYYYTREIASVVKSFLVDR